MPPVPGSLPPPVPRCFLHVRLRAVPALLGAAVPLLAVGRGLTQTGASLEASAFMGDDEKGARWFGRLSPWGGGGGAEGVSAWVPWAAWVYPKGTHSEKART